ncbi:MAG: hypothetical protein ACRD6B_03245 [Bryobacteraceae bacterium]
MAKLRLAVLSILLLGAVALIGCGGGGAYYGVAVGPPPPPPVYGPVGVAPGVGFIWTNGYYDLNGNRWRWHQGRWRRPRHRGDRWVSPTWHRHKHGWVRRGGKWQRGRRHRHH